MADTPIRKLMPGVQLDKAEFVRRYRLQFVDPAFRPLERELDRIIDVAWDAYDNSRKAPVTRKAGPGFADPDYDLSVDWIAASGRIRDAQVRHNDPASTSRVLLINGSSRSEHTCPGESSKSYRLATIAREVFEQEPGLEVEYLDLSRLAAEYGRKIYPCKACVSTAMPLCHWPCSCYPNHALGQTQDWMNDIYPMWVAAHGVMIICPVNWYAQPSALKLMIDRLVCADGGNPDPTSTHGKDPKKAKELELEGWPYPRHLAGRVFSVVVHGDVAGAGEAKHGLASWLSDMRLVNAGYLSDIGAYIGYRAPYATSHDDLDREPDFQDDVRNAARTLTRAIALMREGKMPVPDEGIREKQPK